MADKEGPKYPEVVVKLTESDGNAFAIIGKVRNALRAAGKDDSAKFVSEAMSGDYDNLLVTCMKWVTVE